MRAWLSRLMTSFIVTLGFAVAKLPAEPPLVPQSQLVDYRPSVPLGTLLDHPDDSGTGARPRLNAKGFCCDGSLHWFGCGNWKTYAQFTFGSCRTFFYEP